MNEINEHYQNIMTPLEEEYYNCYMYYYPMMRANYCMLRGQMIAKYNSEYSEDEEGYRPPGPAHGGGNVPKPEHKPKPGPGGDCEECTPGKKEPGHKELGHKKSGHKKSSHKKSGHKEPNPRPKLPSKPSEALITDQVYIRVKQLTGSGIKVWVWTNYDYLHYGIIESSGNSAFSLYESKKDGYNEDNYHRPIRYREVSNIIVGH